jgi:4a-hydroxytetrahydrobiopterin dehydratase
MTRLNKTEIETRLQSLKGWEGMSLGTSFEHLCRNAVFPDFVTALAFVNRLGEVAERLGHHPDLYLGWGKVKISISTHDAGGITEKDFELARQAEELLK